MPVSSQSMDAQMLQRAQSSPSFATDLQMGRMWKQNTSQVDKTFFLQNVAKKTLTLTLTTVQKGSLPTKNLKQLIIYT